jgi:hypothetical protein
MSSGIRKSNQRSHGKLAQLLRNSESSTIVPFPERMNEEFPSRPNTNHHQIDEEDENDDETGNVSETLGSESASP